MATLLVAPTIKNPIAGSTLTATLTGTQFALPAADAYAMILDVGAVSGTSPTLDVAFQHSPDNGTHWYTFAKFAQVTATGQRVLIFTPTVAISQAGSEAAIANTGAAVAVNMPINWAFVRVLGTVGGTTPSFGTVYAWIICQPPASSALS